MRDVIDRFTGAYPGYDVGTEEEPARLLARLSALARMIEIGEGRLPAEHLAEARALVDRAEVRLRTAPQHAVIALAGGGGAGKSTLFNALVGLDLAKTGARRPTTVTALACAWDPKGAGPLLDLLGIPRGRQIPRHGALDASGPLWEPVLSRLVLVDLPDHDSVEDEHRADVDRFAAAADHVIWVLDPQKYADAPVHERYLRPLSCHGDVMTVVLHQTDRLPEGGTEACLADLRRLLAADGLAGVRVVATSAVTGEGLQELRDIVTGIAAGRRAAVLRLSADLDRVAEGFDREFAGPVPGAETVPDRVRADLVDRLGSAAGIGAAAAPRGDRAGGPGTGRAVRRRPGPGRAGLGGADVDPGDGRADGPEADPPGVPVQTHRVDLAVRGAAAELTRGMPEPWADGVRRVLGRSVRRVSAVLATELSVAPVERPALPARVRAAVWSVRAGAVLAVVGVVGLVLAAAGAEPFGGDSALYAGLLPLVVGVPLTVAGGYAARTWRAASDRARREAVRRELSGRVADIADEYLVRPATGELERYREAHALFVAAREPLHVR
ncbi:50S ribosome-binding GTPase [Yinghuangia sp. ASG 101]|uniref:GTPase n=1 Tax=Yinghuangia sp. ASG 101 TaxID=2896848 RepID=UPI001E3F47F3|nr:GTPase [Yinghuangia sp. ASG 101]UGQ09741.1 50S ribosome-binding GTPase [Yinghuangia sp. ASG 101]